MAALAQGHLLVDHDTGTVYRTRGSKGMPLKEPSAIPGTNLNGYLACKLIIGGVRKMIRLHHIVWVSAHGSIPEGLQIDHINRDKTDNRLVNLRLATPKQNAENREDRHGENGTNVKLTAEDVAVIRELGSLGTMTHAEIGEVVGIGRSQVGNILRGESWQAWRVGPDVADPWAGDWEAGCPRTTAHEPDRVNKLKALGNAIVPSVAYRILQCWEAAS